MAVIWHVDDVSFLRWGTTKNRHARNKNKYKPMFEAVLSTRRSDEVGAAVAESEVLQVGGKTRARPY